MSEQDWQARAARRQRTRTVIITALVISGMAIGFFVGLFEEEGKGLASGSSIPPALAVIAVVTFLIAVLAGQWKMLTLYDELERRDNLLCTAVAGSVAMIGYPCWFVLWKGGLVGEPSALWMFVAAAVASTISYIYLRLKSFR